MDNTASNINNNVGNNRFFLYARKSTDVEDRQIRSIPDQILELREFAQREGLEIVEELVEKQSAKIPGRPIFNSMIERLENNQADGILAWHPDRLARNSIDGGRIIYLVDRGIIKALKFPQFWFDPTPQGKFMLTIAFGQSKYFVDNLSENTKRGLRQKVKRGEMPGFAPPGYINIMTSDRRKIIVIDKKKGPFIKKAFVLFSSGNYSLKDICNFLAEKGLTTTGGKIFKDKIAWILSNPFYYGHFRYLEELYEGKHKPLISKKLFDKVQEVLIRRSIPWSKKRIHKPYLGLLRCGECGFMITGETKTKLIKSTNQYTTYLYYRCTKKSKFTKCNQSFIRQEELDKQLSDNIMQFSLPENWKDRMLEKLADEEQDIIQSSHVVISEKQLEIKTINDKLQRLLDSYLDQVIEREVCLEKKAEFLSQKKKLEEQITTFQKSKTAWLEPMKIWIVEATNVANIAREKDMDAKKVLAQKIFGSNLTLTNRKVSGEALNQWSAQRADPPTREWERGTRIGLASPPWEGSILPVY